MIGQPLIVVSEMVYADGWESCGSIRVGLDGAYVWERRNLWQPGNPSEEYRGQLSSTLQAKLEQVAKSSAVHQVAGAATYEYYIDDTQRSQPEAVKTLVRTLAAKHLTSK
jgi:hypothetical protein